MKTVFLGLFLLFSSFKEEKQGCLQMDLILIADMSASVQEKEVFISNALIAFIKDFELSEEGVKIGIITFNERTYIISPLSKDKETLLNKASSIGGANFNTNFNNALLVAYRELNGENSRKDYKKMIIIITDGDVENKDETKKIVQQLRNENISICGIMIENIDSQEEFMNSICNGCYLKSDYKELVRQLLNLDICV